MKLETCLVFISFLFIACNDDDRVVIVENTPKSVFLEAEKLADIDVETLKDSYSHAFAGVSVDLINKEKLVPVAAYRINYHTNNPYNGESVIASGLLLIPELEVAPPIVSYQHGTATEDEDIPSEFIEYSDLRDYLTVLSGLNYIVTAPDYLGYGTSDDIPHPYEHGESLATSSYDMLLAVKEFLGQEAIAYSEKLFLTGYSEGGYATMAMHEYIEKNTETRVAGSVVGGGAYNKTQFSKEILEKNESLPFMNYYLWVIQTYNLLYDDLGLPFSFFVKEKYIPEIVENAENLLNADVNTNPQDLFTDEFRNIILTDADHPFVTALRDNNRFDWTPKGFVKIYHGSEDQFVYPSNASTAYEAMRTEDEDLVTLNLLESPHHTHTYAGGIMAVLFPILIHQN